MKKVLCTIAVAGLMMFGGSAAANAATVPDGSDKYMQQQIAKSLKLKKKVPTPPPVYPGYDCQFRYTAGGWVGYCQ